MALVFDGSQLAAQIDFWREVLGRDYGRGLERFGVRGGLHGDIADGLMGLPLLVGGADGLGFGGGGGRNVQGKEQGKGRNQGAVEHGISRGLVVNIIGTCDDMCGRIARISAGIKRAKSGLSVKHELSGGNGK